MLRKVLGQQGLSNREAEVAALIATGLSNKEAADRLFVTEKTVKFHLTNIYKKMAIRSRAQLIVWCLPHMRFVEDASAQGNLANVAPIQRQAQPAQNIAPTARIENRNAEPPPVMNNVTQLTPGRYGGSDIDMGGGAFGT